MSAEPVYADASSGVLRPSAIPWGESDHSRPIFQLTLVVHVAVALLLMLVIYADPKLSRDSTGYSAKAEILAARIAAGEVNWTLWVDHGWYQFIGWMYYLVGPQIWLVQLVNACAMAWASVLLYRIGCAAFADEMASRAAAYTFAVFPSIVYYTCLPLKEAPALLAICGTAWGVLGIHSGKRHGWSWLIAGLLILTALRVYLAIVLGICSVISLLAMDARRPQEMLHNVCVFGALGAVSLVLIVSAWNVDIKEYEHLKYFDLNYINGVRMDMTSGGKARMFRDVEAAKYGNDPLQDLMNAGKGVFFFFFSIDVTNIRRSRQMAAIPEMLFMAYCLPALIAGVMAGWRRSPQRVLPLLMFTLVLIAIYGGATTNMGAMYRWRLQALPFLLLFIFYGATTSRRGLLYTLAVRLQRAGG